MIKVVLRFEERIAQLERERDILQESYDERCQLSAGYIAEIGELRSRLALAEAVCKAWGNSTGHRCKKHIIGSCGKCDTCLIRKAFSEWGKLYDKQ